MKQRKIPMRTCIITKEKLRKEELIRVIRNNLGNVEIDLTGKKNGRGAYLKKDLEVFKKARSSKILEKVLGVEIKEELYDELDNLLK